MSRTILIVISITLAFALGIVSTTLWFTEKGTYKEIRSEGVLEQIQKVFELVTINGHFSEVYDYRDYYYYDWSIMRKKALVKVKAKVSMGYDLTDVKIDIDESARKIQIGPLPPVEIISMDIKEEFYDIQEGTFNSFQPSDYNKIKKDIRELIRSKARKSNLPAEAATQLTTLLDGLDDLVSHYGWTIEVSEGTTGSEPLPVWEG